MPNLPYFPKREGDQTLWFTNLKERVADHYTALEISLARQTKIQLVLAWLIWTWQTFMPGRRADGPVRMRAGLRAHARPTAR